MNDTATVPELLWADCKCCCRSTRHSVIQEFKDESDPDEYHTLETWQIIQCQGCLNTGFRHRIDNFEDLSEDEF